MSAYELADILNGIQSNIWAAQAIMLTVLSAYLAVAYTVGKDLSRYQVVFINFVFILMNILGATGQMNSIEAATLYGRELSQLRGEIIGEEVRTGAKVGFFTLRALLLGGALAFMWQVRHPKTG